MFERREQSQVTRTSSVTVAVVATAGGSERDTPRQVRIDPRLPRAARPTRLVIQPGRPPRTGVQAA
ncbi:MAG: hypothetical protein CHACPFDD_02873 [Phycisphaerae bacterium]|nr:hypothetical protein [Phycisphaerae bacterium]